MELTLLPLGLRAKVFCSPMPFGYYDRSDWLYSAYKMNEIHSVVVLVTDAECWIHARQNLRQRYQKDGIGVIYLPMEDYEGIDVQALSIAVDEVLSLAANGKNIAVHCHAGVGRTGLFSACLARRQFGLEAKEAFQWIRTIIPGSIESDSQLALLVQFPVLPNQT